MWHMPATVDEALRLKADNPDATIVAGGTFVGILSPAGPARRARTGSRCRTCGT